MRARRFRPLRLVLLGVFLIVLSAFQSVAAVWHWSVPERDGVAYLWIPPEAPRVRAVIFGQHNMLEEGVLEHPSMRAACAELDIAQLWVAPKFDPVFRFDQDAGGRFEALMKTLADESGYGELATTPIVPMGHSACASFPWNFGAWNPGRTLAMISIKGDAPLTTMTGSGRPNPGWGRRTIDGIPGLMVMGEYEWLEERLLPALDFLRANPRVPIAMLAEPGRGHFDCSDELVEFLILFLRKTVAVRMPGDTGSENGGPPKLKAVDPAAGWWVDRWRLDQPRRFDPAPFSEYNGNPAEAFWALDGEMARAVHEHFRDQIGRRPQLLGFVQGDRTIPQTNTHNQVALKFEPMVDGITFRLGTTFLDSVEPGSNNLARWTGLPVGTSLGHASGGGPIELSRITGPITQVAPDMFQVSPNRTWLMSDRRRFDGWLLAEHRGDESYKSTVQQALIRLVENHEGTPQTITFPGISNQRAGVRELTLHATSDSGLPVRYFVTAGPADVAGDVLYFTPIPRRARLPMKVTVVAWQWGRSAEPKVQTAGFVERVFLIMP